MADIRITTAAGAAHSLPHLPGRSLAQAIFLAGLWDGVPLCAGLGKCGLCRVRYVSAAPAAKPEETRRLGEASIAEGWRLSCLHPAEACEIFLPEPRRSARPRSQRAADSAVAVPPGAPLSLAVDLGTTSVHWAARAAGQTLSSGQGLNPQMGLGSEVMSRLSFAATDDGAAVLRELVLKRLRGLVSAVEAAHGARVEHLCVAGNSAMTYLLLGLPAGGLSHAPYRLDYAGGDVRALAPDLPPARIPPLLSPFVGGDLSAGLAALAFSPNPPQPPFLLADLGTNGEFILALSPDEYLLASVPMGPALEGVGLRHGRPAGPGAVRAFELNPAGLRPQYIDGPPLAGPEGSEEDRGITGVGYLSLAAGLLRAGALDEWGRFVVPATPLGRRLMAGLCSNSGEAVLDLGGGLSLPASDLEELVKVKAAFNLALSRLLAEAGLTAEALTAVHLAGAMGEHVNARDLADLGFLPELLSGRIERAGNTSLKGAALLLEIPAAWDFALALPDRCRALDLASDPRFGALYVERMVLRHVP